MPLNEDINFDATFFGLTSTDDQIHRPNRGPRKSKTRCGKAGGQFVSLTSDAEVEWCSECWADTEVLARK